jgi:hypothetical protein
MAVRIWTGRNTETDLGEEFYEITHAGHVLRLGEYNWHDDSDFYALVWDEEAGRPREVTYASTRGWTYNNGAAVDATPEVRAAYDAYRARVIAENAAAAEAVQARVPYVGRHVTVTEGRKVPVGTEGTIFWYGPDKYARRQYRVFDDGRAGYRVGLKTADGEKFFTAATNVEVRELVAA